MSETDDRMERAERIRKMRQSRESDDGESDLDDADASGGSEANATDSSTDTDPVDTEDRAAREDEFHDGDAADPMAGDGTPEAESTTDVAAEPEPTTDVAVEPEQTTAEEPTVETPHPETAAAAEATSGGIAPLGNASGFSLPDQGEAESATDEGGKSLGDAGKNSDGGAGSRGGSANSTEPSVRVLEFTVGEQVYCIDIERVEEIVKRETVTRVPNTEAYVEGVVDLRGQITTILDTKRLLDVEESGRESLLVIFAPDAFEEHGSVGWVVDEVRQVVPVMDSQVRTPPAEEEHVRGIVDREDADELIVWIRPGLSMSAAVDAVEVE